MNMARAAFVRGLKTCVSPAVVWIGHTSRAGTIRFATVVRLTVAVEEARIAFAQEHTKPGLTDRASVGDTHCTVRSGCFRLVTYAIAIVVHPVAGFDVRNTGFRERLARFDFGRYFCVCRRCGRHWIKQRLIVGVASGPHAQQEP